MQIHLSIYLPTQRPIHSFLQPIILEGLCLYKISLHLLPFLPNHCVCMFQSLSRVQLFVTLWTVAHQAPLSMGFPRQEYWCGLPFHSLWDLPNSEIGLESLAWQADSLPLIPLGSLS